MFKELKTQILEIDLLIRSQKNNKSYSLGWRTFCSMYDFFVNKQFIVGYILGLVAVLISK
jgi:hypothetical protein